MMPLKCLIVEDEHLSQILLKNILLQYTSDLKIECATNIEDALCYLTHNHIDLVFLDIQLQEGLSFEILKSLHTWDFDIIFTTACDQYAIEAFKVEAIDYILKPYTPQQIVLAVEKVKKKRKQLSPDKMRALIQHFSHINNSRIGFHTNEGITYTDRKHIVHCEADGSYCKVYLEEGMSILVSKPLKDVEELIQDENFVRVHASYLVNTNHISKYLKEDGGSLQLNNGKVIPISRRKKNDVLELLTM